MKMMSEAEKASRVIKNNPKLNAAIQSWLHSEDRNSGLMSVLHTCRREGLDKETAIKAIGVAYLLFDEEVGASADKLKSHPQEIQRAAEKVYAEVLVMRESTSLQKVSCNLHIDSQMVFNCLSRWGEANFLHEDTEVMREFGQWCQDIITTVEKLDPTHTSEKCDVNNCARGAMIELFGESDNVVCGPCTSQPLSLDQALGRLCDILPEFTATCTYGENRSDVKSIRYILLEWDCQLDGSEMPEDWMVNDNIEKHSLPVNDMLVTLPKDTAVMTFSFLAKFREMGIPVKAVTWSGNKSLHCLIPIEAVQITRRNSEDVKKIIRALRLVTQWLGCDSSCISWGRLTRLPFGSRRDVEGNSVFQLSALYDEVLPITLDELFRRMACLAEEIRRSGNLTLFRDPHYITANEFDHWLISKGKCIVRNELTGQCIYEGWPAVYDQSNVNPLRVRDELHMEGVTLSTKRVGELITVVSADRAFNPVKDYLGSLEWDGVDRIPQIHESLGTIRQSDPLYGALVYKWLLQAVAVPHNDGTVSFENVLTLVGAQGIGKTTFFRMLVPPAYRTEWFREGQSIDLRSPDSTRIATSAWITEIGEADSTLQRKQPALKAFLSNTSDTARTPYAISPTTKPRLTVFGATVNSMTFLNDKTGNRRWWTVPVDGMDINKVRALGDCIDQIWAQFKAIWDAAALNDEEWSCFRLTDDESRRLAELNIAHTSVDTFQMMVNEVFLWNASTERWQDITGTEVCELLHLHGQEKTQFLNALREETNRRGIEVRRPGNRETWRLPPFNQSVVRRFW